MKWLDSESNCGRRAERKINIRREDACVADANWDDDFVHAHKLKSGRDRENVGRQRRGRAGDAALMIGGMRLRRNLVMTMARWQRGGRRRHQARQAEAR